MDNQDIHEQMLANLFGRRDLLVQLSMITHIQKTIDNLEREMHRQWNMAQDFYGQMEQIGLEEELGDDITQIPLRSPSLPSDSNEPLPPYQQTPPPVRHRRPTPSVTIVFADIPSSRSPIPQQPQSERQVTPLRSNPIGTERNPILVEEDDEDTIYCNICHSWGHLWIDCHEYQCEHCEVYGPGHAVSNCFYC